MLLISAVAQAPCCRWRWAGPAVLIIAHVPPCSQGDEEQGSHAPQASGQACLASKFRLTPLLSGRVVPSAAGCPACFSHVSNSANSANCANAEQLLPVDSAVHPAESSHRQLIWALKLDAARWSFVTSFTHMKRPDETSGAGCLILLGALFHLASRQNDRKL